MPCSHQKNPEGHPDFFTRLGKTCSAEQADIGKFQELGYVHSTGKRLRPLCWGHVKAKVESIKPATWIPGYLNITKCYLSEWTTKTQSCEHGNDTATVYDYMSLPAELLSSKLC